MGSNEWCNLNFWLSNSYKFYYLVSKGLVNIREDLGSFMLSCFNILVDDILVYDFWWFVLVLGGYVIFFVGFFECLELDCCIDILIYIFGFLMEDLYIVGDIFVNVYCIVDINSFDLFVVLFEVRKDGDIYNFI